MPNLSTKEIKAKFNTDDLIFRKESNLPFKTLLSLSSYVDIEYNFAESLPKTNANFLELNQNEQLIL